MFERIEAVPPDPILGLGERFRADPNPDKIDLTAGVYKDSSGITPKFSSVARAELMVLEAEITKSYLPIAGPAAYAEAVEGLVFGPAADPDRLRTAQTPGGTGALAVAARLLAQTVGPRRVWLSDPTWANHAPIFLTAGHDVERYRYYEPATRSIQVEAMFDDLAGARPGDVVVIHGCCHNPTGRDLAAGDWVRVAELLAGNDLVGLIDLAYLGLADGLEPDRAFLDGLLAAGDELLVCSSLSKNMGLYRERVGALTVVARDSAVAEAVFSNVKKAVRSMYSNPPSFGGAVATAVLGDPELRAEWEGELDEMRGRLNGLRASLASALAAAGLAGFDGVATERGMFTLTGLTPGQVEWLRVERGIYLVDSGRASVAGLTEATIPRFVEGIESARNSA